MDLPHPSVGHAQAVSVGRQPVAEERPVHRRAAHAEPDAVATHASPDRADRFHRRHCHAGAKTLLGTVKDQDLDAPLVSTLALEKDINTFFRLRSPSVIARLREAFPDLPAQPDAQTVFIKLRELRNSW